MKHSYITCKKCHNVLLYLLGSLGDDWPTWLASSSLYTYAYWTFSSTSHVFGWYHFYVLIRRAILIYAFISCYVFRDWRDNLVDLFKINIDNPNTMCHVKGLEFEEDDRQIKAWLHMMNLSSIPRQIFDEFLGTQSCKKGTGLTTILQPWGQHSKPSQFYQDR